MTTLGIESPTFNEVLECANGAEGNKLFAQFGKETDALIPPHQYTPWIVFNNVSWCHINELTIFLSSLTNMILVRSCKLYGDTTSRTPSRISYTFSLYVSLWKGVQDVMGNLYTFSL